jgi:hypothetical protein
MPSPHELVVRRTQRHDVVLRGRFSVAPPHAHAVRLAKASGARDGVVEGDVVDLSGGGVGFLSPVFFPKRLLMDVQVLAPGAAAPLLSCRGRVTRVLMTDRRPMYLVGLAFEEMEPAALTALAALLQQAGDEA